MYCGAGVDPAAGNVRKNTLVLAFSTCLLLASLQAAGQIGWRETGEASLSIAGTSTMHDWTMTATGLSCQAEFILNSNGAPAQLNRLTVTLPAEALKSEKSGMDKNAYKALKADKHKSITFQLISASVQNSQVTTTGNLSIAGVTRRMDLEATCTPQTDKTIRCTGQKAFKMSDFEVEPPSFMFGTVRTGDAITLTFDVKLAQAPQSKLNP